MINKRSFNAEQKMGSFNGKLPIYFFIEKNSS